MPDFGVSDVERVLQFVLPGQPSTKPLNHAVAQDLQVAPPAGSWSQKTTSAAYLKEMPLIEIKYKCN